MRSSNAAPPPGTPIDSHILSKAGMRFSPITSLRIQSAYDEPR